ncbi:NADH-ubiquinone oxidoreductase-F iron-sulfur binding region domain-containing protein [Ketobacter sp.]|uniref:NADH-ubiquinone oxidoreductase-F iron-sulfur binding region domain-containing protein n=1 Tax=Ketobacter sp. TaxID=2083498 RepID=UPI000F2835F2|nr:NADH-ubiquinone oxidoreductase-F iron-sulfur binding region domain-containing protein [Ketobacter sp.]RLU01539.1 MAG: NADP oxidoreductase [Ketobacter sp.]
MAESPFEWLRAKSDFPEWDTDLAEQTLLNQHPAPFRPERALQSLVVLQQQFGQVSPPMQTWLASKSGVTVADLRSLVSFYQFLEPTPPPRYHLRFANNIIEQINGVNHLVEQARATLHDADCKVETTSCIGLSDHPIAALINGHPITRLNRSNINELCQLIRAGKSLQEWPRRWFAVDNTIHHPGPLTSYPYARGQGLALATQQGQQWVLNHMDASGLRGLGGAGFPTAVKWRLCAEQADPVKYITCNADEGEPGTFKDRFYLTVQTDQVIEGMAIAAVAVGASKGYLYLRGEYLYLVKHIEAVLQQWRERGQLGAGFDIELQLGAGAYVCGEESAMLESLAGKRGIPTSKPPFPGQKGLFGKPTVVNNVETLVAATYILQQGSSAFRLVGTEHSPGSRLHSVSGDCRRPGLYELPQGAPVQDLLALCGAEDAHCVQSGGPSGALLLRHQFQTPLDFESPGRGGSVMVFNRDRSLWDITRNFTRFFQHESCGFCTPCRAGTVAMNHLLDRYEQPTTARQKAQTRADMIELTQLMQHTSHCGLGKTAGLPVLNFLNQGAGHE